jgi:hypothetical protein
VISLSNEPDGRRPWLPLIAACALSVALPRGSVKPCLRGAGGDPGGAPGRFEEGIEGDLVAIVCPGTVFNVVARIREFRRGSSGGTLGPGGLVAIGVVVCEPVRREVAEMEGFSRGRVFRPRGSPSIASDTRGGACWGIYAAAVGVLFVLLLLPLLARIKYWAMASASLSRVRAAK